jgi:hypothetical protein
MALVLSLIFEANTKNVGRAKHPEPTTQKRKGSDPKTRQPNHAKWRPPWRQTAEKPQMK